MFIVLIHDPLFWGITENCWKLDFATDQNFIRLALIPIYTRGAETILTPIYGLTWGFLGGSDGKESACSGGDLGSMPGLGRFPGGGNGNPL